MDLQIRKVIIWPKNQNLPKREIVFELEQVNVITGTSHRGKSSLIHIIDYCLGSGKCTIPIRTIRNKAEWFGVLLKTGTTEILLARKEPGQQVSTDEMYMAEALKVDTDIIPRTNTNRKNVKNRLNQLAGFSSDGFENTSLSGAFQNAAGFRDTSSFQFQPQHIVANPFTLFYKADTYEHQQKLRTILPLILGTVTNEVLALEKSIKDIESQLKSKTQILTAKKQAVDAWHNNLKSLYYRAIELGLIKDIPIQTEKWDAEQYLSHLHSVLDNFKANPVPLVQEGATERSATELNALIKEERELSNLIYERRMSLARIERLTSSSQTYKTNIQTQQKRLEPVSWFKQKLAEDTCPFCKSKNETAKEQLSSLEQAVIQLEHITTVVANSPINLDKEIEEVKTTIRESEKSLSSVREVIGNIYKKSREAEQNRQSIEDVYRFIGRLEEAIQNAKSVEIDSELDKQIKSLTEQLESLRADYTATKEKNKLDNVLRKLSTLFTQYVEVLDVESPQDLVKLDINNLTVKIVSANNRENFLWEVGSGANWMGYHLSTLLAMHEYFLGLEQNFVPNFLFIDQPSQVYFPEKYPDVKDVATYEEYENLSEDLKNVRKIFKALTKCLERTSKKVQLIVVEHAPPITWQGIEGIHLVEEWREDGNALIPGNW